MLKVVVIDGNAISRNLLGTILTNGGHEVVGDTNTSSAGIARMIKLRPQIVCIDIGPNSSEGLAIVSSLREALPKSLVFMISGSIDSATVHAALAHGVHGFVVKPFNAITVLKTIRNAVLKLAHQQRQRSDEN